MKIFTDFHHEDLYYSLHLLFVERLGWELYRPYGIEWHNSGEWALEADLERAKALLIGNEDPNCPIKFKTHKIVRDASIGVEIIDSKRPHVTYKGLRRSELEGLDIDIYISTVPAHADIFNTLIKKYHKNAKHIFQAGNAWNLNSIPCHNIMHSCKIPYQIIGKNSIYYRQEFSLKEAACDPGNVSHRSVVSLLNNLDYYKDARNTWDQISSKLPGFSLKSYGLDNDSGFHVGTIAEAINDFGFAYYVKYGGEGYGHYAHQAIAMGKPLIVKKNLYTGCTIDDILIDGVSCIDISARGIDSSMKLMNDMSHEEYIKLSNSCKKLFKESVDFNEEELKIKRFIENLI